MIPLLLALWFAPQEKPPEKATLSGTVVNSVTREPLARATVLAEPGPGSPAASTTTDDKGRFELVALEPGQYHLKARRNGYQETYYGARRVDSKGTAISLEPAQDANNLEIRLLPYAVVAGTVRDTDGEPIAGARVSLLSVVYHEGKRTFDTASRKETDDLGQYRAIVPPGRYYVHAEPRNENDAHESRDHSPGGAKPPERLVPMYYPGVPDSAASRMLEVEPGTRLSAIDITLPRRRVFRVKVHVDTPGGLPARADIRPVHPGGVEIDFRPDNKGRGDFEFRNVPSGSYVISAIAVLPEEPVTNRLQAFLSTNRTYNARLPIEVGNADLDGIRVRVAPGAEVTARISVEGENPPALTHTHVLFRSEHNQFESYMKENNTVLAALSPDRYEVYVLAPSKLITKSIRADTADVLSEGLTIDGRSGITLDVVLTRDAGRINGVVVDKDEKPVPGATVVLIPEPSRRHRWDLYKPTTADQYGRFELQTLTTGEYKLFAWEDIEPTSWFDPEVLKEVEKHGAAMTVRANAGETANVHLVPR